MYNDRHNRDTRNNRDNTDDRRESKTNSESPARKNFFRRRKSCPFTGEGAQKIDYLDVKLLQKFVSERGKITPRRITGVNAKPQRSLALAIKRARYLALMPYLIK